MVAAGRTVVVLLLALAAAPAQEAGERASALVDRAVEWSHQGRFQQAAEKLVEALALDPKLAEAHYLLGLIRQQDGRQDAALRSFEAALRIDPRYPQAQARVCELMTGQARARETGYDRADQSCRRAALLDPAGAEPHFHIAWIQAKLGNFAGAIAEYRIVLRLDPRYPRARFELAMAYLDSRDTGRAVALLAEVVAGEPANAAARFQLGAALASKGNCKAAVPQLEAAAESAQKHYLLAGCYKKLERPADAAAEMEKVKQLREGADLRMQARYRAAIAHKQAEAGQLDRAIAEYRAALALSGDSGIAVDLAVALLKKGQAEEVIRMLGTPADPLARYQVALAYVKLGRLADARAALEQVVEARPGFVEARYQLGVTLLGLGETHPAEAALRRALEQRPDEPAIRLAWAQALEKLGRIEEARAERRLAGKLPE